MKPLYIGTSPLNRIYCGHLLKNGRIWASGKQDLTGAACTAVAEHVLKNKRPVTVTINGIDTYILSAINLIVDKN